MVNTIHLVAIDAVAIRNRKQRNEELRACDAWVRAAELAQDGYSVAMIDISDGHRYLGYMHPTAELDLGRYDYQWVPFGTPTLKNERLCVVCKNDARADARNSVCPGCNETGTERMLPESLWEWLDHCEQQGVTGVAEARLLMMQVQVARRELFATLVAIRRETGTSESKLSLLVNDIAHNAIEKERAAP